MKNEELPAMQPQNPSFDLRNSPFLRMRRMTYSFLAAAVAQAAEEENHGAGPFHGRRIMN
jgi:hypothetical protein